MHNKPDHAAFYHFPNFPKHIRPSPLCSRVHHKIINECTTLSLAQRNVKLPNTSKKTSAAHLLSVSEDRRSQ